jgi:hypothetical protein
VLLGRTSDPALRNLLFCRTCKICRRAIFGRANCVGLPMSVLLSGGAVFRSSPHFSFYGQVTSGFMAPAPVALRANAARSLQLRRPAGVALYEKKVLCY